jgi:hypothetical protein
VEITDTPPTAGTLTNGGTGGSNGDGGGGGGGGYFGGGGGGGGYITGGAGGGGGSNLVPTGGAATHAIDPDNAGNGLVTVSFTVGDTSCGNRNLPAAAPAAITQTPRFTG